MINKCELVWDECLAIIKDNMNLNSFNTWFVPIKPVKLENNVLTIQVPSQFFYEWLEENYVNILRKTIKRVLGENAKLEYRIIIDKGQSDTGGGGGSINLPNNREGRYRNNEMPMRNMHPRAMVQNPFIIPGLKKIHVDSQLNPSYIFDSFVEGDCNRLARSAGIAVAKSPGATAFNPLVIWGGVGIGKTHLAQAIGNYTKTLHANKTVLYV